MSSPLLAPVPATAIVTAPAEPEAVPQATCTPDTRVPTEAVPRVWQSADLFGGDTVVWIAHAGAQYQLRTTRQGKLILTK